MATFEERRARPDRRQQRSSPLSLRTLTGRRRAPRRRSDECTRRGHYVDHYPPHLLAITLLTFLLCIADAFFTLNLLRGGAEEVNLFMDLLISEDTHLFLGIKFLLTCLGLLLLLAHTPFRIFGALPIRYLLYTVFMMYVVLIFYELTLLPVVFPS